jgi:transposase
MSQGHYARIAAQYDAFVTTDADIPFFVEFARQTSGPILELMAGTGRVTLPLLKSGAEVVAVDYSPVTDRQWALIRPLLPHPARTGRSRADDRRTIEGILYVLITGCRWQDLPHEYGAPTTVWQRLRRWGEEGIWERIWRAALAGLDRQGQLDWGIGFIDGSFAPAKRGGDKVGLTRKGKGTKWMLVIEAHGLPLGFHLDSAACAGGAGSHPQPPTTLRPGAGLHALRPG